MTESSPIRGSFAAIHQNPVVVVIEIAWRWAFGLLATVLLWLGARAFIAGVKFSEGDGQALRGHDPTIIAAALTHILQQPGVMQSLCLIAASVAVPSAIVWITAATFGRAATLKRLIPGGTVNLKAILGLNIARAGLLFVATFSWWLWMVACSFVVMSPGETLNALYLLLALMVLPVIGTLWGLLNWLLSLAPIVVSHPAGTAWNAYTETVGIVRKFRGKFASVSTWLGLPRLAAMVITLIFAIIILIATDSVVIGTVALAILSLVYCAFADYLYVVRLAAYAQIARELPIATAATPL